MTSMQCIQKDEIFFFNFFKTKFSKQKENKIKYKIEERRKNITEYNRNKTEDRQSDMHKYRITIKSLTHR